MWMWEVAPSIEECGAVGELASGLSNCSLYINCHPCAGEDLGQKEARRIYRTPSQHQAVILAKARTSGRKGRGGSIGHPYSPEPDINRPPHRPDVPAFAGMTIN